jgi:hypothetical protein
MYGFHIVDEAPSDHAIIEEFKSLIGATNTLIYDKAPDLESCLLVLFPDASALLFSLSRFDKTHREQSFNNTE